MKFNIWNDFPQKPLPELLDFIVDNRGKTVPTVSQEEACEIVLIATNCIRNENLYPVYEKVRYISKETYEKWFRAHPISGDIIFVNKGTPGRICFCPENIDFCIAQDMMAFRVNSSVLYNKYLLAVLRSREMQEQIRITSVGDTIPHFKKEFLKELTIPLPPMDVQQIIGDYYFKLSEKIELNNKINENLEQQAQAIYRSMFVTLHHDSDRMGLLSELITVKYGKDHKKLNDGVYPVYGSGGIMRYVERPLYDKESVLIPRKGSLNNVMYVNEPFWSVDTMFYTEMKQPNVAKFVFHFVKSKDLASLNAGSAVPSMTTDILNSMELRIPSADRLAEFEGLVAPLYRAIEDNTRQSARLAALRDTLLPKLMNGEIDVSAVKI